MFYKRKHLTKRKKLLLSIALSIVLFLSIGYSLVKDNIFISSGATFSPVPMVEATTSSDTKYFRNSTYKTKIKTITFEDKINVPSNAIASWDIGVNKNGDVMSYVVKNTSDTNYYDLYIQANGKVYANENMSYWFSGLTAVDAINGIDLLNTNLVKNMSYMFNDTGLYSTSFTLDLGSNFNTENVTNMGYMFKGTGYNSTTFTLELGDKFNTSKVTNMSNMFQGTGYNSTMLELNTSDFDTSNVTSMHALFYQAGRNSTALEIDVSNFNTSNVTNMSRMFYEAGYSNPNFTLDVSNFDTTKVTDMSLMFYQTGYNNVNFALDVSKWNTSNVTNMGSIFRSTGYNSTVMTLDVSKWDTSNVTDMNYMFYESGYSNTNFVLDVSNFKTNKVTDMGFMFYSVGYNNQNFTLDVSNFDTSNVTNMYSMFRQTGRKSTIIALDLSNFDTSKVTSMHSMFYETGYANPNFTLNVSNFDTSKVTDMSRMFYYTGYTSTVLELDVSNFDTSNVTTMSHMFHRTGYNSTLFTLNTSNFNTSKVTDMSYMFTNAGYDSTIFNVDTSGFDTSSVKDFNSMFYNTGKFSTNLKTSIAITNPNTTNYEGMFFGVAMKTGSEIIVHYTPETSDLVDQMVATKTSGYNVYKGIQIVDTDNLKFGDLIIIENEKFNVISQTDTTVTMLAQYNLDTNYLQSSALNEVKFSTNWDHEHFAVEGNPMEAIDISTYGTVAYNYTNNYVKILQNKIGTINVEGTILNYYHLKDLGCSYDEYYLEINSCPTSSAPSWLLNNQITWTAMVFAIPFGNSYPIYMDGTGGIGHQAHTLSAGIRPVITISKEALKKPNKYIVFSIDGISYQAEKNMTWLEWIDSEYNTSKDLYSQEGIDVYSNSSGQRVNYYNSNNEQTFPLGEHKIISGTNYTTNEGGGI